MITDTKYATRKQFREIRSQIPAAYRHEAARAAANIFISQPAFTQSQRIACYLPTKHEFDATPIIEAIWQAKKYCYVPVLVNEKENILQFVRYQYGDALRMNRFSILEPIDISQTFSPEKFDLVLTPLIAFDREGHRLGTGGGYYDRTFAFLHQQASDIKMWGLGYAAQEAKSLPSDPWDIHLQSVMTEREIIDCHLAS